MAILSLDILVNAAPAGGHPVGRGDKNLDNKLEADPNLVAQNTTPEDTRPPRIDQCRNPPAQHSEAGRMIIQQQQGKQRVVSASVISQQSTGVISQQRVVSASVISQQSTGVISQQRLVSASVISQQSTGVISQQQQQGKHQAVTASEISQWAMQVVLTQMIGDLGIVVQ